MRKRYPNEFEKKNKNKKIEAVANPTMRKTPATAPLFRKNLAREERIMPHIACALLIFISTEDTHWEDEPEPPPSLMGVGLLPMIVTILACPSVPVVVTV